MNWFRENPLKVFLVVLIVVVASIATVHAYFKLLFPQAGPRVSITSPPLEFSMELDKAEYASEENIKITFLLRNISNQTITVGKPSLWPISNDITTEAYGVHIPQGQHLLRARHFDFAITASNGTEVFKEFGGVLQMTYDIVLEPDGYIKQTLVWIPFSNLPLEVPYHLFKGTYQIRGIQFCGIPGLGLITLETPSITFIIK